jgi:thiamine pyrophosphokinase
MKYEINFPLKNKSEKISLKQSGQISNVIINTCSIHVKYKVIIIFFRKNLPQNQ